MITDWPCLRKKLSFHCPPYPASLLYTETLEMHALIAELSLNLYCPKMVRHTLKILQQWVQDF